MKYTDRGHRWAIENLDKGVLMGNAFVKGHTYILSTRERARKLIRRSGLNRTRQVLKAVKVTTTYEIIGQD